jgi:YVTN family beta-propeller protein
VGASRIAVGDNPSAVIFNAQGTRAFVANSGAGSVSVIDTATRSVVATSPLTGQPSALDVVAGGGATTPTTGITPVAATPATAGTPAASTPAAGTPMVAPTSVATPAAVGTGTATRTP